MGIVSLGSLLWEKKNQNLMLKTVWSRSFSRDSIFVLQSNKYSNKVVTRLTSKRTLGNSYQDFVVRHSVCSQATAIKGDTIGGSARVHCIDLPCEQPIMDAPESSCGTKRKTKKIIIISTGNAVQMSIGHPHLCLWVWMFLSANRQIMTQ